MIYFGIIYFNSFSPFVYLVRSFYFVNITHELWTKKNIIKTIPLFYRWLMGNYVFRTHLIYKTVLIINYLWKKNMWEAAVCDFLIFFFYKNKLFLSSTVILAGSSIHNTNALFKKYIMFLKFLSDIKNKLHLILSHVTVSQNVTIYNVVRSMHIV